MHASERALHWSEAALFSQVLIHHLRHTAVEGHGFALLIHAVVLLEQLLEALSRLERILLQAKDLESLLFRHETALNSKSLLGDLLAALVREFLA